MCFYYMIYRRIYMYEILNGALTIRKFSSNLKKKKNLTQILTLPVAQQWHLSDRRTTRVHEILHIRQEFLFLGAGLPFASPYNRRRWPPDARYHHVRTRRSTLRGGRDGGLALVARLARRRAALFTLPPRPSFQFWR